MGGENPGVLLVPPKGNILREQLICGALSKMTNATLDIRLEYRPLSALERQMIFQ